jgi:hypothetical protein
VDRTIRAPWQVLAPAPWLAAAERIDVSREALNPSENALWMLLLQHDPLLWTARRGQGRRVIGLVYHPQR